MGVKIREKAGRLYLDVIADGRRRWISTGLTRSTDPRQDKEIIRLAEIIRSKEEARIVSGEWGLLDPIEGKRSLIEYAEELTQKTTLVHLSKSLRYLREYSGGVQIGAVTEKWLDGYRGFLLEQKTLSKTTAAHYFAAICFVFKRALRDRIIPRNPAEGVKRIPIPEPMKVYLTVEELARLAAHPLGGELGREISRGFLFACMVGLRVSDVISLQWGDIERGPEPRIKKRQKKTEAIVGVPINKSAWTLIDDGALHHHDELVFPRLSQSKTSQTQYFDTWAKSVKLEKKIGWHTARHTFAVLSLEAGTDLYTVSKLLGHTDIATTQVYAKATDSMKRKAVDALPEVELGKARVKK
jgi:integrase